MGAFGFVWAPTVLPHARHLRAGWRPRYRPSSINDATPYSYRRARLLSAGYGFSGAPPPGRSRVGRPPGDLCKGARTPDARAYRPHPCRPRYADVQPPRRRTAHRAIHGIGAPARSCEMPASFGRVMQDRGVGTAWFPRAAPAQATAEGPVSALRRIGCRAGRVPAIDTHAHGSRGPWTAVNLSAQTGSPPPVVDVGLGRGVTIRAADDSASLNIRARIQVRSTIVGQPARYGRLVGDFDSAGPAGLPGERLGPVPHLLSPAVVLQSRQRSRPPPPSEGRLRHLVSRSGRQRACRADEGAVLASASGVLVGAPARGPVECRQRAEPRS